MTLPSYCGNLRILSGMDADNGALSSARVPTTVARYGSAVGLVLDSAAADAAITSSMPANDRVMASRRQVAARPDDAHHFSTHGRSTTSNAHVERCCRCSCRYVCAM